MPRASARKAHHPHHGRRRPAHRQSPAGRAAAGRTRAVLRGAKHRLRAPLAGYNQHPLVSRLGRSGEKAGQTRPRAAAVSPCRSMRASIAMCRAPAVASTFGSRRVSGIGNFFGTGRGGAFVAGFAALTPFGSADFLAGGWRSRRFWGADAARFNMARAEARAGFGLRRDARPKLGILAGKRRLLFVVRPRQGNGLFCLGCNQQPVRAV